MTTKILTKEDILNAQDSHVEPLEVPEWGGHVLVKALSGAERDSFEASISGSKTGKQRKVNLENLRARLVALCLVDDKGKRLFTTADVHALGQKSAIALERVFEKATELAGMGNTDIEDMTANFTKDQSADSISS